MTLCPLTTREAIKAALDVASTTRANWQIDEANAAATDSITGLLHRTFRPLVATYTFDWPKPYGSDPAWQVWLDNLDLISVDTLTVAGAVVAPANYRLRPNSGPPYTNIQANLDTVGAFNSADTWQGAVTVAGLFGFSNVETSIGTIAGALDSSQALVDVSNGSRVGIGDLIRVESERMIVTDRSWLDTGTQTTAGLNESQAQRTIPVDDGSLINVGELILVESEVMWVTDVVGNNVTARRAWDGSLLAAHSGSATVYASRQLTCTRAALGTTAASHNSGTALYRHDPPPGIRRLARAEALVTLGAEQSGYAESTGTGVPARKVTGNTIDAMRAQAYTTFGRKARFR